MLDGVIFNVDVIHSEEKMKVTIVSYEGRSKSFAIQCNRLNVDKFMLSQMLPTYMSSVVWKYVVNVFINYCMAYVLMTSPTQNVWNL